MKQMAIALLGVSGVLISSVSEPVQSTDLQVNFNKPADKAETKPAPQPAEISPDQPATPTPPRRGGNAPCIACGMG